MMHPYVVPGVLAIVLLLGSGLVLGLWQKSRSRAKSMLAKADQEAQRRLARAELEAQRLENDVKVLSREKLLAARTEFERETRDYRQELDGLDRRLAESEARLREKDVEQAEREERLAEFERILGLRELQVAQAETEVAAAAELEKEKLELIAGLTADQAKQELLKAMENEARIDAAGMAKRIEDEAVEKAKERARRIISMAIQRIASEHVVETTVSVVDLPSDEMKGRIIGREGRNIRVFEQVTGVDLIVDDTPEAVILSCFEPVRREIARIALATLIQDGRIHPGRIEEVVTKVQAEMDEKLLADGEAAALETGIPDLHPEISRLLGRLQFRSSYGQNALKHSLEVGWLASHMAAELGADAAVAKRAGLLHDLGKAVDREMDGTHLELGRELLKKYGESDAIIHAMECHHGDYDPRSVEAVLVTAADALSAARPGARREILENYIKRIEKLESMAIDFKGVSKAYAIQAGRELRIVVESRQLSDENAAWLARDLAKKIESELTYPGQIKVTVIRETRSIEYAR